MVEQLQRKIRSESRVVRPFAYDSFLDGVGLSPNPEYVDFSTDQQIDLTVLEGNPLSPALRIPDLPEDISIDVGCQLSELKFVVWLSDPVLKTFRRCLEATPAEWPSDIFALSQEDVETISWEANTRIGASLVLAQNRNGEFGYATRAGHWVAQKEFWLKSRDVGTKIPIEYVSDDDFVSLGYSADSNYVVKFDESLELNEPLESDGEFPFRVLFSEKLASRMQLSNSPVANSIAAVFNSHVVMSILKEGFGALEEADEPIEGSTLFKFAALVEKQTGYSSYEIRSLVTGPDADKLRSALESKFGLRQSWEGSLV